MPFIIFFALLGFIVMAFYSGQKKYQTIKKNNPDMRRLISAGTYIGGHPNMNNAISVCLMTSADKVNIMDNYKIVGQIPYNAITDIGARYNPNEKMPSIKFNGTIK